MNVVSSLKAHPPLRELPAAKLDALAFAFVDKTYAPGERLVELGSRRPTMRILLDGEVSVSVYGDDGEHELARLRAGEMFGLLSLIDRAPASAVCRAVGPVRVAELTEAAFATLSNAHVDIGFAFQRALGRQIVSDFRRLVGRSRAL